MLHPSAKCSHLPGNVTRFAGVPVDPCQYVEVEIVPNATVHVLRCQVCGHVEIEWERPINNSLRSDINDY